MYTAVDVVSHSRMKQMVKYVKLLIEALILLSYSLLFLKVSFPFHTCIECNLSGFS
jgi:hypothetical protein